jgi:hypothetical protein
LAAENSPDIARHCRRGHRIGRFAAPHESGYGTELASYWARDGGLLSYGTDQVDAYRRAASYVDRILRGEKLADLPVQLPTKFHMVVNRKTATAPR